MKANRSLCLAAVSVFALAALSGVACSGSDSGGDGDGDTGTGGGTGTGGDGGDGDATGGTAGDGDGVPGTSNYDCTPASGSPGSLALEPVASDLTRPLLVVHPPDDDRLFAVEQGGLIRLIDGATNPTYLDISDKVLDPSDGVDGYQEERGLLGVAFHPDFATNNLLYVHYSARSGETDFPDGQTVIAEYTAGPTGVDVGTERVVLDVTQPATNHNGGSIVFGGDGMLYIALGDGGGGDDQFGNGQDETTLLGAILRINPLAAGGEDYTVPAGNLSETLATAAPELWDYGLRNPFRMNFDGCTGDLYIGDVGQNAKEEIDIERAGEGHHNYGWPIVEGTICGPAGGGGCDGDFTAPATDYDRGDGGAVIGGSVYRGSEIPWLRGTYFFTDQIQEQVWSAVYDRDAGTISTPANMTSSLPVGTPAAIQNGNDGELYFVSLFGGTVYKLVQAP